MAFASIYKFIKPCSVSLKYFAFFSGFVSMELNGIIESLDNKSILVTGSTGFLAKIFVEKVLRVQPNVKRLYLLIRAADSNQATQRFRNEVVGKELFRPLREKYGAGFDSFISNKVIPVVGDASFENIGIQDQYLRECMWKELNIIVNSAATTKFDDRYDVALGINTVGAKYVLNFAKKCGQLEMFLHVSTAFVCGEQSGIVLEKPVSIRALNGKSGLDIEEELKLVNEKLDELRSQNATKEVETVAMKEFGIKRSRFYGWPNSYVFTKSLGEMILGEMRGNIPLVIIRPTVVTSTYKEPFPGWVEGVRTVDSLAVGYGKGKLTCFLGDPESILDIIPGDMVVNAMILAMVANSNQSGEFVYHVGSSISNPLNPLVFRDYGYNYFSQNPLIDKEGKHIIVRKVNVLTTMDSFHTYLAVRYIFPMKGLKLLNAVFCQRLSRIYNDLNQKINLVLYLVELYQPYIFFKGIFDDINTQRLRMAVRADEADTFYIDTKCINWEDYFVNTHIPGFVKYAMHNRLKNTNS